MNHRDNRDARHKARLQRRVGRGQQQDTPQEQPEDENSTPTSSVVNTVDDDNPPKEEIAAILQQEDDDKKKLANDPSRTTSMEEEDEESRPGAHPMGTTNPPGGGTSTEITTPQQQGSTSIPRASGDEGGFPSSPEIFTAQVVNDQELEEKIRQRARQDVRAEMRNERKKWIIGILVLLIVVVGIVIGVAVGVSGGGGSGDKNKEQLSSNGDEESTSNPANTPPSPPTLDPTPSPTRTPAEPCTENADCLLGSCAYEDYTAAATSVCCPTGSSIHVSSFDYSNYPKPSSGRFCNAQPVGARCPTNNFCESGVCIFGSCEAQPRATDETCQENADCVSGVCAFGVCHAAPFDILEECEENADCLIGRCAYEDYTAAAKSVCCPTGESIYVSSFDYSNYPKSSSGRFCNAQPVGARCPTNNLCESGVCISASCEAQPRAPDEACQENADCMSGVCAFGVCHAGPFDVLEECQEAADCLIGSCAYEDYTAAAKSVCCPSGSSIYISSFDYSNYPKPSSGRFCNAQPVGARCPTNNLCESGVCIFGSCEAQPRAIDEACQENADCATGICAFGICQAGTFGSMEQCEEDADCTFGECAYSEYTASSNRVCCPTGASLYVSKFDHSNFPKSGSTSFCVGQPLGARCPVNNLCDSGTCTLNVCS